MKILNLSSLLFKTTLILITLSFITACGGDSTTTTTTTTVEPPEIDEDSNGDTLPTSKGDEEDTIKEALDDEQNTSESTDETDTEKEDSSPPEKEINLLGKNLLTSNGDFDDGQGSFSANVMEASVSWNDEVHVEFDGVSAETWEVQVMHLVVISEDKKYTFCYEAKASSERTIFTDIDSGAPDYASIKGNGEELTLTENYQQFKHTFNATQSNLQARLTFNLGQSDVDVFLDNIGLYEGDECGSAGAQDTDDGSASTKSNVDITTTEFDFVDKSNYPFPQNAGYEAGRISTLISPNELKLDYNKWKSAFIEECEDGVSRVIYPQFAEGNSGPKRHTNSEGIGYGMLIAGYMGDKALFDNLYAFYKKYGESSGIFMHWRILSCDGPVLTGAASDGDIDVAFSLIVADKQWGGNYYSSEASTLIAAMREEFFIDCNGRTSLKPGDEFGSCTCVNPSYYAPGYYRVFSEYDSNSSDFWDKARDDAYEHLKDGQHPETGLVRAWADAFGESASACYNNSSGGGAADDYQFDALRTPWRVSMDYVWTGDSRAQAFLQDMHGFVNQQPVEHITPSYFHDGTPFAWDRSKPFPKGEPNADGTRASPMVGGFTTSQLAGSQRKLDEYTAAWQSIYKRHDYRAPGDGWVYNASLSLMYGILVSGNFWDPLNPMEAVSYNPNTTQKRGNKIINSDFSDALHRWTGGAWDNNQGHVTVENGELHFVIKEVVAGKEEQLVGQQRDIPVSEGETYELSFSARAEENRDIVVIFDIGDSQVKEDVRLTTTMEDYTIQVTVPMGFETLNLTFGIGHTTDDVWLDNVHLIAE